MNENNVRRYRKERDVSGRMNKVYEGGEERHLYTAQYKVNHSVELLEFLLSKSKTSRNNVKSLLTRHQVLVNGSPVTQYNFMLAKDDEVKISKNPVKGEVKKQTKKSMFVPDIIYEDEDFIAINKPCGLLSVESDKSNDCAFVYMLDYLQKRDKTIRPYILHRIDKETSGVLIFAKNIKLHSIMKLNWNEFVKTREYYAVVEGVPQKEEDTIVSYLKENKNHIVYSSHDPSGQKATTHYQTVKANGQYTLLRVCIDSGRKNQIRVHMHDMGNGIVGDEKYGYTKDPLKRLGLHASCLEFEHPITKKLISITAPVPQSFYQLFK